MSPHPEPTAGEHPPMSTDTHVHVIPEITHWTEERNEATEHACYYCKPDLYDPMPKNCTLCDSCGVFLWTGVNHTRNALTLCPACEEEILDPEELDPVEAAAAIAADLKRACT